MPLSSLGTKRKERKINGSRVGGEGGGEGWQRLKIKVIGMENRIV
jgi:hypothetical protein